MSWRLRLFRACRISNELSSSHRTKLNSTVIVVSYRQRSSTWKWSLQTWPQNHVHLTWSTSSVQDITTVHNGHIRWHISQQDTQEMSQSMPYIRTYMQHVFIHVGIHLLLMYSCDFNNTYHVTSEYSTFCSNIAVTQLIAVCNLQLSICNCNKKPWHDCML